MDSYSFYIYSLTILGGVIFLLLIIFMINDFLMIYKENQTKQKNLGFKSIQENIEENKSANRLDDIIKNEERAQTNQNLYILKEVNSDYINRLNSINIFSIKELRNKANTGENIELLSDKTGIRKRLLDEWVRLGEFSRIQGIRQEHIKLFEKVGIKTVHELKDMDAEELYTRLNDLKKKGIIDSDTPTIGMITRWIRLSRDIPIRTNIIKKN